MLKRSHRWKWFLLFGAASAVALAAETMMVVQVPTLTVRSGKGSMYSIVGTLKSQDQLDVLEEQSDGWLHVKVAGKDGYVNKQALIPPKHDFALASQTAGALPGSAQASQVGASAAGNGLTPEAQVFAVDMHYDPARLTQILASRQRVEGQPWLNFTYAYRLNPYKNYQH